MDLIDDQDLEWMAGLDWKAHGPARDGYVSRDMFLAEAAEMLGRRICGVWPGPPHFLRMAQYAPPSPLMDAEDAFDAEGRPIGTVHDREGERMRSAAVTVDVPLADPDAITPAEWNAITSLMAARADDGVGARRAAAGIARAFARMAFEDEIDVFARPADGQGRTRLGPEFWEVDDDQAIRRLAACGLSPEAPYDPRAAPDHRIFVGHERLAHAIAKAGRRWYVPVSFIGTGVPPLEDDHLAVRVSEVAKFLAELMVPANSDWNNADFMTAVQDEFGSGGLGVVYERAKAQAVSAPERRYFGRPGRRRIPAR